MSRVSFMEDFFGRGGRLNAHLFDSSMCAAKVAAIYNSYCNKWFDPCGVEITQDPSSGARIEVMSKDNSDFPGAGLLRLLAYGKSDRDCDDDGTNEGALPSAVLTFPEMLARKNPVVGARVLQRQDEAYNLDLLKQQIIMGFTKVGQWGTVADDMIGFRLQNDSATQGTWKALYKEGGTVHADVDTGIKQDYLVPVDLVVTMNRDEVVYQLNDRIVHVESRIVTGNKLHFEILIGIYSRTTSDIYRELLVDAAWGSLER
ncbi:MAG: hypothetical protein HY347_04000 [candidate division NC10 bacterium]|nr:hypothetical protein [candidate division NC10 bacterium]